MRYVPDLVKAVCIDCGEVYKKQRRHTGMRKRCESCRRKHERKRGRAYYREVQSDPVRRERRRQWRRDWRAAGGTKTKQDLDGVYPARPCVKCGLEFHGSLNTNLCPTCRRDHSRFRHRARLYKTGNQCCDCGAIIMDHSTRCKSCLCRRNNEQVKRPARRAAACKAAAASVETAGTPAAAT